MRRRARIDANQPAIVKALRDMGATVQSLAAVGKGCPDLLVGAHGFNLVFEVKDGSKMPSSRKLTPMEIEWFDSWEGQVEVVETPERALEIVRLVTRERV